jgi:uncharacterized protein (DUF1501 family)
MLDCDISIADAKRHLHVDEPTDRPTLDRRRFLQLVGMGLGAGLVSGPGTTLLDHMLLGHDPSAWAAGPLGSRDGVLVVICMFGGNDGLNTVVPFNDGLYYDQHGALAMPGSQTLPITGDLGLHPHLTEFKRLWDAGQLAVVEGVGYPKPNLSHFTSMAYWMAAQPSGAPSTGWIGRWLDHHLGGTKDLYAAAEIGQSLPLQLVGNTQRGTVAPEIKPEFGASYEIADQRFYRALRGFRGIAEGPWQAAVADAFIDQLDMALTIAPQYPATPAAGPLASRLEVAARLINANLGFRVLTASWGDFDSHAAQHKMFPARMTELNDGVRRFFEVLDPAFASRVTVMTFSEFGRTSWANAGLGTDHGSSAPHFVFGANVKGGLYGGRPSLQGLGRWDRMPHHVDFRSYYGSLIDGWLGGGSSDVLGGNYENLDLFRRPPGLNPDGSWALGPASIGTPSRFTPVEPFRLLDTRDGTGGVLTRPLAPGERIRVRVAGVGSVPGLGVTAVVANVTAVDSTAPNFFTVYPGGTLKPWTSNLNAGPGRPVPNLVVMGVETDGHIEVFNSAGDAHCLVDVFGYFSAKAGDRFTPVTPARLFDTRDGLGVRPGKIPEATPIDIQVAGLAGVPPSGASAVVLNLTVTEPESAGWMRATPTGQAAASTSNINFAAWDTVPNLVICKLGDGGRITIDGHGIGAHVLADVFGYFGSDGRRLTTLPPQRLLDTREGLGAPLAQVGGGSIELQVGGRGRVPTGAAGVILNVTATNVTGPSFVTVWPNGEQQPFTSNLNVVQGQTVANLVICRLGANAALRLASPNNPCDLIADVLGYFAD